MADVVVNPECKDPKELFAQGARAFILQDYEAAVAALSKTSELLASQHKDDTHSSLGEVYLYYGQSLLGLVREQNEPLGDAVPKDADNESDGTEEEPEDDKEATANGLDKNTEETNTAVEEAKDETNHKPTTEEEPLLKTDKSNEETKEKIDGDKSIEGNDQTTSKPAEEIPQKDTIEEDKPSSSTNTTESTEAGPSKEKSGGDDDGEPTAETTTNEEPSDLQVAWEVLELAKKIFDRDGDRKRLAETLITLGELSLENENFQGAVDDIKTGLEIQKELFSNDNRTVAESFYKLGMAYSMLSQTEEAVGSFNTCLEFLKNRVTTLEKKEVQDEESKSEIEEIKNLMPDIEEKITDVKNYKEEAIKKLTDSLKEAEIPTVTTSNSKEATDISHLVKRKRKIEENGESEVNPAKKPAVDL